VKKLRIGISLFAKEDSNIWQNGINQNIALLAWLLQRIDFVESVDFINGGPAKSMPAALCFEELGARLVRPEDVVFDLDLLIEMGAVSPIEFRRRLVALGGKCVVFEAGHNFSGLVESMVHGAPNFLLDEPELISEIWGLPQHRASCYPLLATMSGKPVIEMPHLWAPYFLNASCRVPALEGALFGFDPSVSARKLGGWRVGIFEPNLSAVKHCLVPMLVCDQARSIHPECITDMMVQNTGHWRERREFVDFAQCLPIVRENRATFNPRAAFSQVMAKYGVDAVLAHQWECGLNYAYYDALHGGYPLIHNSPFLKTAGLGFFYNESDIAAGAEALHQAWQAPVEFWTESRSRAADWLARLSPDHPENIRAFEMRLQAVFQS
jgi:hypothetical protein